MEGQLGLIPHVYLPMRTASDVTDFLASPDHYRPGYSAQCIAESWHSANGLPSKVREVLETNDRLASVELVDAFMERQTSLLDPWTPSQSDVLAILGLPDHLALMTVEGKVKEGFGPRVAEWLAANNETPEPSVAKTERLARLRHTLGLDDKDINDLRYQLLHRTVAAIYEANRYRAHVAVMMVHSFDPNHSGLSDFKVFAARMGFENADVNNTVGPINLGGIKVYLGWTDDDCPVGTTV